MRDKKRLILVGASGFGRVWRSSVLPQVSDICEPVAVVDIRPEALAELDGDPAYSALPRYSDIRRAFADIPADFAAVVVPAKAHRAVIEEALAAGLHILCEKPLAGSMEDCAAVCRAVTAAGKKLAVTMSHRFEREKQTVEALVKSGTYGPANYLVSRLSARISGPQNAGLIASPLGLVSNATVHALDTARGVLQSNAKTIYANHWLARDGEHGVELPSSLITVEMENGARALFETTFAAADKRNGWGNEYLRVECASGTITADCGRVTVSSSQGPQSGQTEAPLLENRAWGHEAIVRSFCAWLEGGEPAPTSLEDNLQCCALAYAAAESAETGCPVDLKAFLARYQ